jgi:hypothetical protein
VGTGRRPLMAVTTDTFGSDRYTARRLRGNAVNQLTTIAGNDDYFPRNVFLVSKPGDCSLPSPAPFITSPSTDMPPRGNLTLHIQGPNGVRLAPPMSR